MSTDWIKMRVDLRTHPKVVRMASALKADKLRVIGGLFAVWSIFDAHAVEGLLEGYNLHEIDEQLGWKGFAAAMHRIDWLSEGDDGLTAPRFDEHNGQSAKRRAMDTERKRLDREAEKAAEEAAKAATKAGQVSASEADKSVTREEKRREEEKETTAPSVLVADAAAPSDPKPPDGAEKPKGYAIPDCPYATLLEAYHAGLPTLPTVSVLNDARREHMRARWREVCTQEKFDLAAGLEWFRWYFAMAGKSRFLTGRGKPSRDTGRAWHATFDWLFLPTNFAKVVDGNYLDERAVA